MACYTLNENPVVKRARQNMDKSLQKMHK